MSLTGLYRRWRTLGNDAAQPSGLDRVSDHAQADQEEESAPGDARLAREGPDQPDGRQVRHRLGEERGQRHPTADLVPSGMAVEEPPEAPAAFTFSMTWWLKRIEYPAWRTSDADHLVLGQQVADGGESADRLGVPARASASTCRPRRSPGSTAARATPPAMKPLSCEVLHDRPALHLADAGEHVAHQPDAAGRPGSRPSRADRMGGPGRWSR